MKTLTSNNLTRVFLFAFFLLGFIGLKPQLNANAQAPVNINTIPLQITSDKMIAQQDTSTVEFIGNVKAKRVDSVILADSIKIFFINEKKDEKKDEKKNDVQTRIKEIVSTGNVQYTDGERKGFADKAVFTTQDEVLILTGTSPKLVTGSSFVTGKKITLFTKQDKVIVESDGSKRVEAVFNPEDNTSEKP